MHGRVETKSLTTTQAARLELARKALQLAATSHVMLTVRREKEVRRGR